ncbi:MAG: phosphoserine aminotransferase, partial [Alphaproteobacteria bacterium]|nr:phosphoserine aminotransferase [Alphaproteobacteria bacterium]
KLSEGPFRGETLNTPSMLCVADAQDALGWAESVGGCTGLIARTEANFAALSSWVGRTPWVDFLAVDPASRSTTSVCLKIVEPWFQTLDTAAQWAAIKQLVALLEAEDVAYDVGGHRDAPPSLRIWCGATVDTADVDALGPWLDWAYAAVAAEAKAA